MVPMGSIDEETVRWDFFILSSEKKSLFDKQMYNCKVQKLVIVKYRN